jgi:hypothetical protein
MIGLTRFGLGRGMPLMAVLAATAVTRSSAALAQSSPFLTGATALQSNIIAWLTPIAVILIMVLGAMAMANRIVENCGNTLILRCSASEGGGTSRFASRLIGEREVLRTTAARSRRPTDWFATTSRSEHFATELAVLPSQIEQLPDLAGLLKLASRPHWLRITLAHGAARPLADAAAAQGQAKESPRQWQGARRAPATTPQAARTDAARDCATQQRSYGAMLGE